MIAHPPIKVEVCCSLSSRSGIGGGSGPGGPGGPGAIITPAAISMPPSTTVVKMVDSKHGDGGVLGGSSTTSCSPTAAGQATSSSPHRKHDQPTPLTQQQQNGDEPSSDGGEADATANSTDGAKQQQLPSAHQVSLRFVDASAASAQQQRPKVARVGGLIRQHETAGNNTSGGPVPVYSSGDDDDDDDDSLAAIEAGLALLQKYNANTSARGISAHKRNSIIDNSSADSEGRNVGGGPGPGPEPTSVQPQVTASQRIRLPLRAKQQQQQQQPVQQSQRRVIFPALYGAASPSPAKETEETQAGVAAESMPQQNLNSLVSPSHRRSKSFDDNSDGAVPVEDPRERTLAFISTLKSPLAGRKMPQLDRMPSNEDLLNAMDDRYEPSKSKQQKRPRRKTLGDMPVLPLVAAKQAPSAPTPRSSTGTSVFSPPRRNTAAPVPDVPFAIPPFRRGRGAATLAGEAASGEIVCHVATNKSSSSSSPHRKVSLFDGGSTLPKVQPKPKVQPAPLTPRSPPTRDAVAQPLPSILRKTSSLINSPIAHTPKATHRATVSFGSEGQALESDDIKTLDIPDFPRLPSLTRSSSVRSTSSEVDSVVRKSSSPRDELSIASSSSLRSNSSIRRVSSENSIASSHETERKRATAVTLAAAAMVADDAAATADGKKIRRKKTLTRHASLESSESKEISFDPRVWVVEYEQDEINNWFSQEELEKFKCEAIDRIRRRHAQQQLLPSGTGRIVIPPRRPSGAGRALFSDPALGVGNEAEDDDDVPATASKSPQSETVPRQQIPTVSPSDEKRIQRAMLSEIRNILVVDPHDLFLKLFAKSLHSMMSHVIVTTATSAEEALRRIAAAKVVFPQSEGGATHGFDIIIVEERLQLFHRHRRGIGSSGKSCPGLQQAAGDDQNQRSVPASGSALISQIVAEQKSMVATVNNCPRFSLLIGVSAHLQLDGERLSRGGADFVWGKPPPAFDDNLRVEILRSVLHKRGKAAFF